MTKKTVRNMPNHEPKSICHYIAKSLKGLSLTTDKVQTAPVGIKDEDDMLAMWFHTNTDESNDGEYDIKIHIGLTGKKFSFRDEVQRVTQASVDFDVKLIGCTYNKASGWSWKEPNTYNFSKDPKEACVVTYFRNSVLNPNDDDDWIYFAEGVSPVDDESLVNTLLCELINNTTREEFIETFKLMLTFAEAP